MQCSKIPHIHTQSCTKTVSHPRSHRRMLVGICIVTCMYEYATRNWENKERQKLYTQRALKGEKHSCIPHTSCPMLTHKEEGKARQRWTKNVCERKLGYIQDADKTSESHQFFNNCERKKTLWIVIWVSFICEYLICGNGTCIPILILLRALREHMWHLLYVTTLQKKCMTPYWKRTAALEVFSGGTVRWNIVCAIQTEWQQWGQVNKKIYSSI